MPRFATGVAVRQAVVLGWRVHSEDARAWAPGVRVSKLPAFLKAADLTSTNVRGRPPKIETG
jgi:hypothetical protein